MGVEEQRAQRRFDSRVSRERVTLLRDEMAEGSLVSSRSVAIEGLRKPSGDQRSALDIDHSGSFPPEIFPLFLDSPLEVLTGHYLLEDSGALLPPRNYTWILKTSVTRTFRLAMTCLNSSSCWKGN